MRYVIMADGDGKRWNNYMGIPKHLVQINGEPILARTVRLLRENGINDIVITSRDERYNYATRIPQTIRDCEIDRFEASIVDDEVCYIYGDVYYTTEAIKTIVSTITTDIMFFGSNFEIFAIKVMNMKYFMTCKQAVKDLYINKKINRCIGWEIYRYMHNIPFEKHLITDHYTFILDETDDIDYPSDYEMFKEKIENRISNSITNKISVIIPCYNNANNTKQLLTKLLQQKKDYPETEIIVVENGSTEDMRFLEDYSWEKVKVKHEIITGASHARNIGLKMATGQYICFIDNDDDISNNYLHILYQAIRQNNSYYDFAVIQSTSDKIKILDYTTVDLSNPIKKLWSCWHYCYNRRILENIYFDETLNVAEDIDWLRRVLPEDGSKELKGVMTNEILYYYKWDGNENSLSHRFNRGEITRKRSDKV